MNTVLSFLNGQVWLLLAVLVIGVTVLVQLVSGAILKKLIQQASQRKLIYLEAFLLAIKTPIIFVIGLVGLSLVIVLCAPQESAWATEYVVHFKRAGFILLFTWAMVRFIKTTEKLTLEKQKKSEKLDATMIHAISLLLTITAVVIGGLALMQLLGLPVSGLLAFGGIGGAAIAFASKDLLANFFGGLVVYLDKPFKVGHMIRSPDKPIEGIVEHIGWRVTRIRTLEKRPLYVPNSLFLTISVENVSRMLNRRIKTVVGVRYCDAAQIDKITKGIEKFLINHEDIDQKLHIQVCLTEFGASSLDILIDAFTVNKATKLVDYRAVRHEILMKVLDIITANGAECAFPTQTVYLENGTD